MELFSGMEEMNDYLDRHELMRCGFYHMKSLKKSKNIVFEGMGKLFLVTRGEVMTHTDIDIDTFQGSSKVTWWSMKRVVTQMKGLSFMGLMKWVCSMMNLLPHNIA